jgi:hypothetical protein
MIYIAVIIVTYIHVDGSFAAVPVKVDRDANLVKSSGIKFEGLALYVEHKVEDVQKDPEF